MTSAPGTVTVLGNAANGYLVEASYTPGQHWTKLRTLPVGKIGSRPAAVVLSNGEIDVFWRGVSGRHLRHAQYSPGRGWGKPQNLGGQLASVPAPVVSGKGVVNVFWRGTNGQLWQIRRNPGSSWGRAVSLGTGQLGGAPSAIGLATGEIDVAWPASGHTGAWRVAYTGHRLGQARWAAGRCVGWAVRGRFGQRGERVLEGFHGPAPMARARVQCRLLGRPRERGGAVR